MSASYLGILRFLLTAGLLVLYGQILIHPPGPVLCSMFSRYGRSVVVEEIFPSPVPVKPVFECVHTWGRNNIFRQLIPYFSDSEGEAFFSYIDSRSFLIEFQAVPPYRFP